MLIRAHNIEHLYYDGLSKSETNISKKIFFKTEAKKLKDYEKILYKADHILTISPSEHNYFSKQYFDKAVYIPAFHQNIKVRELTKKGNFALYHGDLRTADNVKSVYFLIEIFKQLEYPLIIASSFKNDAILSETTKYENIKYVNIKDQNHVIELFDSAHINVLPTFQKTGIKLKLINTLYNGRFCVATTEMVEDTGLESFCEVGKNKVEFAKKITELIDKNFDNKLVKQRELALESFDTKINAQKIINLI